MAFDYNNYYELDYIQSSGTQYINTGISPKSSNFEVYCKLKSYTRQSGSKMPFGVYKSSTQMFGFNFYNTGTEFYYYYGTNGYGNFNSSVTFPLDIRMSNNSISLNGTTKATYSYSNSYSSSIFIFCANDSSPAYFSKMQLERFKITYNGEILRDFVPAKQKSDNAVGLYDVQNEVFYGNNGSGTFTYGQILYNLETTVNPQGSGTIVDSGSGNNHILTPTPSSGYKFLNWLVKGYTQLEYIESDGTQYIDTGCLISANTGIEIDFSINNISSTWQSVASTRTDSALSNGINIQVQSSYCPTGRFMSDNTNVALGIIANTRATISAKNGVITDANGITTSYTTTTQISDYTLSLMALHTQGLYVEGCSMKLYYCKIYDGTTLVRDYIPVIRHSDGQVGLLDLVHFKFYGNSGTGTFIAGPVKEVA